ncbi:2-hydroxyacid dehydrogenase [Streptomyces sp. MNP-20]|uniref:2-hydroxyacid dehydrogenase n=1 Tax=Streptomyces sp. MNP-20 TaxID=2721165 RepID=UPI0015574AD2|nr:2-hydroxyacid dehydrogenase [Streptomyces sp. MNP-20]
MTEVLAFGVQRDERPLMEQAFHQRYKLRCVEDFLTPDTAPIATGYEVVSTSVNADLSAPTLRGLADGGTKMVVQRSTGFNNVDLAEARRLGIGVARVGYYSPYAVAEFAWTLAMAVNRRIVRAATRTRDFDFRLDGLLGRDIHGMTVGVVGTGKIGTCFARIAAGFGTELLGWDLAENPQCQALGMTYTNLPDLLSRADVVSLHVPLLPETRHMIDAHALALMKNDALLVNSSRGALVDTEALIQELRAGRLRGVGLDVYEEEAGLFFTDHSLDIITDDTLARLMTFNNALVTSHQAYFTHEALHTITSTTVDNIDDYWARRTSEHVLVAPAAPTQG